MEFKDLRVGDVIEYDGCNMGEKLKLIITWKSYYSVNVLKKDGSVSSFPKLHWDENWKNDKVVSRNRTVTVSVK